MGGREERVVLKKVVDALARTQLGCGLLLIILYIFNQRVVSTLFVLTGGYEPEERTAVK